MLAFEANFLGPGMWRAWVSIDPTSELSRPLFGETQSGSKSTRGDVLCIHVVHFAPELAAGAGGEMRSFTVASSWACSWITHAVDKKWKRDNATVFANARLSEVAAKAAPTQLSQDRIVTGQPSTLNLGKKRRGIRIKYFTKPGHSDNRGFPNFIYGVSLNHGF